MTYCVVLTEIAEAEVDDIFFWLVGRNPNHAAKWLNGFRRSIATLSEFPERCQIAREDVLFDVPVRQHLFEKHRILYTLIDSDGDGTAETVRILHVRHGARQDPEGL